MLDICPSLPEMNKFISGIAITCLQSVNTGIHALLYTVYKPRRGF